MPQLSAEGSRRQLLINSVSALLLVPPLEVCVCSVHLCMYINAGMYVSYASTFMLTAVNAHAGGSVPGPNCCKQEEEKVDRALS